MLIWGFTFLKILSLTPSNQAVRLTWGEKHEVNRCYISNEHVLLRSNELYSFALNSVSLDEEMLENSDPKYSLSLLVWQLRIFHLEWP